MEDPVAMVAAAAEVAEAAQAAGVTEEPAAVNDQAEVNTPDEEQALVRFPWGTPRGYLPIYYSQAYSRYINPCLRAGYPS